VHTGSAKGATSQNQFDGLVMSSMILFACVDFAPVYLPVHGKQT
jgi:hypothetical protein